IPPVRPTISLVFFTDLMRDKEFQIDLVDDIAPYKCDPTCNGQIGAKGYRNIFIATTYQYHRYSNDCPHKRRQQNNLWQHLPTHPSSERGKQFKIAITHPFFSCEHFEELVNRPQG